MNDKVSILLWLFHPDLAQEFHDFLYPIKHQVELHLSLCSTNQNKKALEVFEDIDPISIKFYPNVGADLYSFISDLPNINNPYFIKIHSKKTLWGNRNHTDNYCNWRHILLDSLIGDKDTMLNNLQHMQNTNSSYLCSYPFQCQNFESVHQDKIAQLSTMLQIEDVPNDQKIFSAGNMFFGKTSVFQKRLNHFSNRIKSLLARERGKIEENYSTYCHSLERIFGYMCHPNIGFTCGKTFKIAIQDQDIKELNFRKTIYDKIYCVEQPLIYGDIQEYSSDKISVFWHNQKTTENYCFIGNNTYINVKYRS